jgi:hypothetical protein
MPMLIDEENFNNFTEECLFEIQKVDLPIHTQPCPHCGIPVKYPIIARGRDIEDFRKLMQVAYKIMRKYGITQNLLAEIKAECLIGIARHKALNDSENG